MRTRRAGECVLDAPVNAYIAAMPGGKRAIVKRLDALIARNVRKAVKWNPPFYGIEGHGWFLWFHVFIHYVKLAFFRGTLLRPVPPGASKHKEMRSGGDARPTGRPTAGLCSEHRCVARTLQC